MFTTAEPNTGAVNEITDGLMKVAATEQLAQCKWTFNTVNKVSDM